MDILAVHPDNLRNVWPQVRAGLDTMPAADWIAEDVYHAIRSAESVLIVGMDESGFVGFLVLREMRGEFSREPYMQVWIAYNTGDKDVFAAGLERVRECARKMGAKKITFGSPRKGWGKRYPLAEAVYNIPMEAV